MVESAAPYEASPHPTGQHLSAKHLTIIGVLVLLLPASAFVLRLSMGLFRKLRKGKHEDREHIDAGGINTVHPHDNDINEEEVRPVNETKSPTMRLNKGSTITVEMTPYMRSPRELRQDIRGMISELGERFMVLLIFHATSDEDEKAIQSQVPELKHRCLFYETDCLSIVRQFQPSAHFDQDADRTKELVRLGFNVISSPIDSVIIK